MRRVALVFGNAAYQVKPLTNPVNDAEDIATKLESFGFQVHKAIESTHLEMEKALKDFRGDLYNAEVGLFFFAGHGIQVDGANYLLPIDNEFDDELEAKHKSLNLNLVIETMEKANTSTSIVILDACRDNPWEKAWKRSLAERGLAPVNAPLGSLVAFSTSPGQIARDGKGRNGAYTAALLQHIASTDCSVETMFKRVRNSLSALTDGKQVSWEHTSLAGEFFFNLEVETEIDDYPLTALRDGALELDQNKRSHQWIKDLKSCNWDKQNEALKSFKPAIALKCSISDLFVVGRNIYQAACGESMEAQAYISEFGDRTQGLDDERQSALLHGMLFEIFFNSDGRLRDSIKGQHFNEVFDLQKLHALAPSFDFIARCLSPHVGRFHAMPGKSDQVVIDIKVEEEDADEDLYTVKKVYFNSQDVLRIATEDLDPGEEPEGHRRLRRNSFERILATQLVVPRWRLTINYGAKKKPEMLRYPRGWTVRRPL